MADIKVDKIKYMLFLQSVNNFIDNVPSESLPEDLQAEKNYIIQYIEREQRISDLMDQRKMFYDFYITNKYKDPVSSNQMYKKYLDTKAEIERIRKMN